MKNNLQIVMSLLSIQANQVKDPVARDALLQAQTRINALALVHRNGWRPLLWTHWGRDWEARATPESITAKLVGRAVAEGSVLLLHDADDYGAEGSWRRTAAALPRVLAELEGRGLEWTLNV